MQVAAWLFTQLSTNSQIATSWQLRCSCLGKVCHAAGDSTVCRVWTKGVALQFAARRAGASYRPPMSPPPPHSTVASADARHLQGDAGPQLRWVGQALSLLQYSAAAGRRFCASVHGCTRFSATAWRCCRSWPVQCVQLNALAFNPFAGFGA